MDDAVEVGQLLSNIAADPTSIANNLCAISAFPADAANSMLEYLPQYVDPERALAQIIPDNPHTESRGTISFVPNASQHSRSKYRHQISFHSRTCTHRNVQIEMDTSDAQHRQHQGRSHPSEDNGEIREDPKTITPHPIRTADRYDSGLKLRQLRRSAKRTELSMHHIDNRSDWKESESVLLAIIAL
jgi:hypothetical protein